MNRFSSKSNARRAARTLSAKLDKSRFHVEAVDDTVIIVASVPEVTLDPEVREILSKYTVRWPVAPDVTKPYAVPNKIKQHEQWARSTCEKPTHKAQAVYARYLAEGRIDERKAAIEEAMSEGVQRNTAHTQYRLFRIANGLPGAVGNHK